MIYKTHTDKHPKEHPPPTHKYPRIASKQSSYIPSPPTSRHRQTTQNTLKTKNQHAENMRGRRRIHTSLFIWLSTCYNMIVLQIS